MSTGYDVTDLKDFTASEKAMIRAAETGRNVQGLNKYLQARLLSRDGTYYHRCVALYVVPGEAVRILCTCPAGNFRESLSVPCWAAGALAHRLERDGIFVWDEDLRTWTMTDKAHKVLLAEVQDETRDPEDTTPDIEMSPELIKGLFG